MEKNVKMFSFSNDDGTSRQESGAPSSVSGSYSFITPEGELVDMQYTADENGFHASGSHMPTTAPPPPHVQRLLDHLAKVNGGFLSSFYELNMILIQLLAYHI